MLRFAALVLAILVLTGSASADQPVRYDIKASIEPAAGTVAVRGSIVVPVEPAATQVSFGLHRTFAIRALNVEGKRADFSYQDIAPTPFNPATRNVIVKLPTGAVRDGTVRLKIAYAGKLEQIPEWGSVPGQKLAMDDQVNARLVELANYSSWYPQFFPFGHRLQVELQVSLPKGWTAVSAGTKREESVSNGQAVTRWSAANAFDILITAAPNFRLVKGSTGAIEIYHTRMPDDVVAGEAEKLAAAVGWFTERLGAAPENAVRHVYAPMKYGQGRAGIARSGVIVTSEGRVLDAMAKNPDYTLFQDIANEIAHFWWNFGSGQGDWVNEAFAEYFSALAVRSLASEQQFEAVLQKYDQKVRALPPSAPSLATVPAQGGDFVVRYLKGSLMLDDFRHVMGDESFFQASRDFYQTYKDRAVGTAEFRSFWRARAGAARVDAWIDSTGGVPALPPP